MFAEAVNDAVKAGHRYGHPFAIMFMDLDRFKNINDTLGHAAGDILLIETAKRLKECVRKSDVIARIGCWQEAGRLPVQWTAPWAEHDNATVRAPFGRVAYRDRARPTCLRHAFTAADQGSLIYRRTGNLRAVQLLLGHTKIESTVRYLGIDVDDALAISEQVEI
jgi:hypothetical protein